MIKRILLLFFIVLIGLVFTNSAFASSKITNVSFDDSDKIIFLSVQKPAEETIVPQKIKIVKLEDPSRIYFDLPNTIFTMKNTSWTMFNSVLKEVKVAQTSLEPDTVRVVITSDADLSKISVMQLPSGYLIRYNTGVASNDYLSEFYRDKTSSDYDYYEKLNYIDSSELQAKNSGKDLINNVDKTLEKINSSLSGVSNTSGTSSPAEKDKNIIPIPAQNLTVSNNVSRIKTKYYLNRIDIKRGNILISGIGSASLEKVKVLTEPNRIVFDMPNAILNPALRNNEYKINETEKVRLGQFEQSKVRIVITTDDISKYKPIFSQDMQGILFAHSDRLENIKLFDKTATLESYTVKHTKDYDMLTLNFTEPVIQSVVRDYNNTILTVYNMKPVSPLFFTEDIKNTMFKDLKISKISSTEQFSAGQMLRIPLDKYDTLYAYEAQSGKQLVLKIEPQQVIEKAKPKVDKAKIKLGKNDIIIIDPGHGGPDVGATRNNIFEKDLNLEVSKKVYDILTKAGLKVEMTRTNDVNPTLQERCDFSNERKSVLFVSIHTNASVNEAPHGIETHFYHDNSIELSNIVHKHLISETKAYDRGTIKSMFYVINHTNVPSILVEMGYISNNNERNALLTKERQDKTAKAIAEGIIEYLKGIKK